MSFEQKTAQYEHDIAKAKDQIEFAKSLAWLEGNKHFRRVFTEGFMRDNAARMVGMSVQLGLSPEDRAHSLGTAQAAGFLAMWMSVQHQMAEQAQRDLESAEANLTALREAGDDDEQE